MNTPGVTQEIQGAITPQFGVRGGINFSDLHTKDAEESKMLTGFNIGIYGKLPISNNFAFQPEFSYTTKGSEVTYNNAFVNGTARFRLNYLEMPFLFVVNITDNFNLHFGPYVSCLVSGKVTNKSNIDIFDFEDIINADDYNRFDVGVAAGAGFDFKAVSFGARYTYGLTIVGKEKTYMGTTYTFPDANNAALSFYVSVPLHNN
jgi:hypothetical protein